MAGNILSWIKANLLIVISGALIVILLPVGWYFSSGWNNSIQEKAAKAFNDEKRRLNSASSIEYSLPAVLEGEEAISEKRAPNTIVTQFYKEQRTLREQQVAEVVERGTEFNSAGHPVLIQGLFPDAGSESNMRKLGFELGEMIAGTPESPSIYAKLLRKFNAGDAPSPDALTADLNQFKKQQLEAYAVASSDGRVSNEQNARLDQDLLSRRLGKYAGQAELITFYCPITAIQTHSKDAGYSHIPAMVPGYDVINETSVFTWIWDYWIISDILKAVATANTDSNGVSLAVPDAPVKHVEQIRINEFAAAIGSSDSDDSTQYGDPGMYGDPGQGRDQGRDPGRGRSTPAATSDQDDSIKTYTSRTENSAFDIRYVDITIIASSQKLPAFFDALGKTNYMTVVDVDLSQVDVWNALDNGYYYGQDHLIRAQIKIETVWLRSWTLPLMPEAIRTELGILPDSEDTEDSDG